MSGILTDVILELTVSSIIDKSIMSGVSQTDQTAVLVFFKDYKITKGLNSIETYDRKETIFDPV